ncbi:hypothetical protein E5676_scaffold1213G00130 [Cucumis melo var. makuwa]|uniref:Uncharacterized protein n=1 Tax=Cucumis melo var. makuwa TaxID=1194695 RepID=A0A5D3DVI5_CUCMM|nr:hypothetical protein E5676_scaffold1213G00130 [Cucumis melo var. makuwa]
MGVLRDHYYYDTDMMERPDEVAHTYDCIPLGITKDQLVPTGAQIARIRGCASSGAKAEVLQTDLRCESLFWFVLPLWLYGPSSVARKKMSPRRGARRGGGSRGREAGRTQSEEQPALQATNPNAPVTQVSYRDGAAISRHAIGFFSTFSRCPADPGRSCSGPDRPSFSPYGSSARASSIVGRG